MQNNILGNRLLFIVIDKGRGGEILNFAMELGVRGATAFRARGCAASKFLKFFNMEEVHKEIIMIAIPARMEEEIVQKIANEFHFGSANKGIIFTLELNGVYGSSHFEFELSKSEMTEEAQSYQVVMTIVSKDRADEVLDFIEKNGFSRGLVVDAHGSAEKSNLIFNLVLEPEKEIILTITTLEQAVHLSSLLSDYLNLESANSGISVVFDIKRLVGASYELESNTGSQLVRGESERTSSAIFVIVENGKDEAVIQSAELAGSLGGTIVHARGSSSYYEKNFFTHGIQPEREIVMIIADNDKIKSICERINADMQLEKPGKGIMFVAPLYDTTGLVPRNEN